jgi:hypothetical protein
LKNILSGEAVKKYLENTDLGLARIATKGNYNKGTLQYSIEV